MKTDNLPIYTVSQVNGYARSLLNRDNVLSRIWVKGEISNYTDRGHCYFSLKDEQCVLPCIMYQSIASRLNFTPTDGKQVIVCGQVSVYVQSGKYQLICKEMISAGRGSLDEAFEQLRSRLEKEGLFDEKNKKPLPGYPGKIALVTSPKGAAVRDMIHSLGERWPLTEVLVVPVSVQGDGAAGEIAAAIHRLNNRADIDLIITGRGGGSKEDLWAFNEEAVARAIFLSNIPVISAVGHERDVTIADYVADRPAITPTKAAVLAVHDQVEVRDELDHLSGRLARSIQIKLDERRRMLERLKDSRVLTDIKAPIRDRQQKVDELRRRMGLALRREAEGGKQTLNTQKGRLPLAMGALLAKRRGELGRLAAGLDAMSPLKVLGRGYAIARMGENVVSSLSAVHIHDPLEVLVSDGILRCEIKEKEERTWK